MLDNTETSNNDTDLWAPRGITISGPKALLHKWKWDDNELHLDFSSHLSLLGTIVDYLQSLNKPILIGIEGYSGAGKSTLAHVLESNGANTVYLDIVKLSRSSGNHQPVNLTDHVSSPDKTYIIDEAGLVDQQNLINLIENLSNQGAAFVLLYQTERDLPIELSSKLEKLKLDNFSLKRATQAWNAK